MKNFDYIRNEVESLLGYQLSEKEYSDARSACHSGNLEGIIRQAAAFCGVRHDR